MRWIWFLFLTVSLCIYPEEDHGRLATANFYLGQFEEASLHANQLLETEEERIRSHALYLLAQIEKTDGNPLAAREAATQALEIAKKLSAPKDVERIETLLESL